MPGFQSNRPLCFQCVPMSNCTEQKDLNLLVIVCFQNDKKIPKGHIHSWSVPFLLPLWHTTCINLKECVKPLETFLKLSKSPLADFYYIQRCNFSIKSCLLLLVSLSRFTSVMEQVWIFTDRKMPAGTDLKRQWGQYLGAFLAESTELVFVAHRPQLDDGILHIQGRELRL